jgi:pyruvate,water dikinase
MGYLLRFDDPQATRIDLSGGKGANLSFLTQRGFPVPPGFILTAQAYVDFIATTGSVMDRVRSLPLEDAARLREESGRLRAALSDFPLPPALADEVRRQLREFPASQAFSVRSSSTMEDLANAAFAGQHDTYLNCVGPEEILEKIRSCYLSLWQDRAIAYRSRQGFDHAAATMAVVVQKMVFCDVAGVAFTINPVSGNLQEMIVDANYGLGESVVSGDGEIDHYVVDKTKQTLRAASVAKKTRKIVSIPGGGTREVEVSAEEAGRPCLDTPRLLDLASLLLKVEASYRFPQDVEWGLAGGSIHLLQSRPVTMIPPRWTRDESAERFPNVMTPLSWDFVEEGFHSSLNHSFRLLGFPAFGGKWFGMHDHYIYGNQNAVEVYGRYLPAAPASLEELRASIPQLREKFGWVQELPVLWSRDLDYYLIKIGEFLAEPLESKDLAGVWDFVKKVSAHGARYFEPNIAISITHGAVCRFLLGLLQKAAGEKEGRALFDDLLAFCDTKTGAINRELVALARKVRAEPALERLLGEHPSRTLLSQRHLEQFPAFGRPFEKFLRDHGHRELDFDMVHPTWVEAPWAVLDNVKLVLKSLQDSSPSERERDLKRRAQQAEFALLTRLPQDLHYFAMEILRLARCYTSLDDLEHYQTTRLTLPMRRGLRELGRRLVGRGILEDPMDVFFARVRQLDEAVSADSESRWRVFAEAVRREKQAYLRDRERRPEWVLGVVAPEAGNGEGLSGLAGSPGQVEGPVFIVQTPDDFARFPKGSVLVARTTNPTWTPLFYSAVAVVTESGGPLSHGAVTAREMQIPAVMAVRGCLTRLKNGNRIRVDGTQGRVSLL